MARRNGFSRPLHPRQLFLYVHFLFASVLLFAVYPTAVLPYLLSNAAANGVLAVSGCAALCLAVSAVLLTASDPRDPGAAPQAVPGAQADDLERSALPEQHLPDAFGSSQQNPDNKFCLICQILVHQSSLHCRYCDKCVSRMDHHCFFVNNCIELSSRPLLRSSHTSELTRRCRSVDS
ncbi:hypothetical protein DFJ73DRAFT_518258 [Zopfochytrium polystomum]|nr:hypothetical protein DFJ73DRAFT_518258 [Zopfochytrium polystomum]